MHPNKAYDVSSNIHNKNDIYIYLEDYFETLSPSRQNIKNVTTWHDQTTTVYECLDVNPALLSKKD